MRANARTQQRSECYAALTERTQKIQPRPARTHFVIWPFSVQPRAYLFSPTRSRRRLHTEYESPWCVCVWGAFLCANAKRVFSSCSANWPRRTLLTDENMRAVPYCAKLMTMQPDRHSTEPTPAPHPHQHGPNMHTAVSWQRVQRTTRPSYLFISTSVRVIKSSTDDEDDGDGDVDDSAYCFI